MPTPMHKSNYCNECKSTKIWTNVRCNRCKYEFYYCKSCSSLIVHYIGDFYNLCNRCIQTIT